MKMQKYIFKNFINVNLWYMMVLLVVVHDNRTDFQKDKRYVGYSIGRKEVKIIYYFRRI